MPKTEIDYSNTIFYKISCKSEDNDELYIGHTTNFVQRKSAHKNSCNNPKSPNYPVKLYKTIRDCGGWGNWNMEIIAFRNCNDSRDARKAEQEYYENLGATLNSIQPLPPPKIPILTEPRNIHTNDNTIIDCDDEFKYKCNKCDFKSNKRNNYNIHLTTAKHKRVTNNDSNQAINRKICECGKEFNYRQGLSRHRKKCKIESTSNTISTNDDKYDMLSNTIMILVKENQEFRQLMTDQNEKLMEVCKTLLIK